MKNVCISIVITVFNIENYIERCINSILDQNFEDLEILLIDDGSNDSSSEICDHYASIYNFIKTFHLHNGGPSSARNFGIKNARGKYICFFDGDDFISNGYLKLLYNEVNDNNLDILIANNIIYPKMEIKKHYYKVNKIMTGKALINTNNRIHTNNDLCWCWRMIYRTEFIKSNNLWFNEKIFYGEDTEFNLKAMVLAGRTMGISEAGYCYDISRNDSLMRTSKKPLYESSLLEQYKTRKNIYGLNQEYDDDLYKYNIECLFWRMINNEKLSNSINRKYINKILKYDMFCDAKRHFKLAYKTDSKKAYIVYILIFFNCSRILTFLCDGGFSYLKDIIRKKLC